MIAVFFEIFQIRFAFLEDDTHLAQVFLYFCQVIERVLFLFLIHSYAGNLLHNLPTLNGRHLAEMNDVSLENNVVAIGVDVGHA